MLLLACRQVMQALAAQEKWTAGWVFDGRKNLYSPEAFLPQNETTFEVSHSSLRLAQEDILVEVGMREREREKITSEVGMSVLLG
jgi:hypothetical protein